jgi:hypothetical protein
LWDLIKNGDEKSGKCCRNKDPPYDEMKLLGMKKHTNDWDGRESIKRMKEDLTPF